VVATRAHFLQPVQFPTDAGGAIHCLSTEKRALDGVVTRISRSLRPLEG